MAFGQSSRKIGEINVTPFVDVVLVLLVIFMVTAPMLQTGIEVNVPEATLDPIPTDTKPTVLSITSVKKIFLGETEFRNDEIEKKLIPLLANQKETIYIRADESLSYGYVTGILSRLHNAGVKNVSLVTQNDG